MTRVTLRHRWSGRSELEALDVVARALAPAGFVWADALADVQADGIVMVKMHGQEIAEAADRGLALVDLAPAVEQQALAHRLPSCVLQPMLAAQVACHGIPMGIHRSNAMWMNVPGGQAPSSFDEWLSWLEGQQARVPRPLAVSAEPWQLGLLFENVLLSRCGPALHERVFAVGSREAAAVQALRMALEGFEALRRCVGDRCAAQGWRELAAELREGRAAAFVMGDWARKEFSAWGGPAGDAVREWPVPGTQGQWLYNVDYFVPVCVAGRAPAQEAVARLVECLTHASLQQAFNHAKGSHPAVRDAQAASSAGHMVPSMSFDHACSTARRALIAACAADFFLGRISRAHAIERLLS